MPKEEPEAAGHTHSQEQSGNAHLLVLSPLLIPRLGNGAARGGLDLPTSFTLFQIILHSYAHKPI